MRFWLAGWILLTVLGLQGIFAVPPAGAQTTVLAPGAPDPKLLQHVSPFVPLTSIPVPYDPLEVVTSGAQQVQSAEERAAAIDLLAKARQLSNVRQHAYELKTSFTSYGSSSSDGRWILEDMSPSRYVYCWTAQGPGFSGIFLDANRLLSSNQPGGTMPLRLAQVRDVMWGVYALGIGPLAALRVANGYLNGVELRCVLVSRDFYRKTPPQYSNGRSFDESEYCVDPKTGLLETYSPYAGLYIHFDYANALHFHEQIIPDGFTLTEHGKAVIEDKTESVTDAAPKDSNLYEPAGLNPLGVGQVIVGPMMVHYTQTSPALDSSTPGQVVVVRGMLSPNGALTEIEVLASTNSSLDQAAVDQVKTPRAFQMEANPQPGTTPQAREVIYTIQFAPRPPEKLRPPAGIAPGVLPGPGTVPH